MEKEFLGEGTIIAKVEIYEVRQVEYLTQSTEPTELDLIRSNPKPSIEAPLRQFGRVPHLVDRYYDFLVHDADRIKLDENNEDSVTYMYAMQRSDFELWLKAMRSKMESMKINSV